MAIMEDKKALKLWLEVALEKYKKFLLLSKEQPSGTILVPSREIDLILHHHMKDPKFTEDCLHNFGDDKRVYHLQNLSDGEKRKFLQQTEEKWTNMFNTQFSNTVDCSFVVEKELYFDDPNDKETKRKMLAWAKREFPQWEVENRQGLGDMIATPLKEVPKMPTMDLKGAKFETGDILLFSGNSKSSIFLRKYQSSPYSHVGMVFVDPISGNPLLWHSTTAEAYEDKLLRNYHPGVQINSIIDVVTKYDGKVVWRPLQQLKKEERQQLTKKMEEFIQKNNETRFPPPWEFALTNILVKKINKKQPAFFCSELVAETYQHTDLFPKSPEACHYSPAHFEEDPKKKLQLPLQGASLGHPILLVHSQA